MPPPGARRSVAPASKLRALLASLRQGDVISLGAVTLVGRGSSPVLADAGVEAEADEVWSLTVESDAGWYVLLSQDCDIVRGREDEPCLLVSPIKYVSEERWLALRHGPSSPREFPYPPDKLPDRPGQRPVADLRFVTSVDKAALLHESVESLRPLSGRQRERFAAWVGRRFTRAAHDDLVVEDVLGPAGALIRDVIGKARKALASGKNTAASGRFALAVDEWHVGGSDKLVQFHAIVTAASLRAAGLANDSGEVDDSTLETGRAWIEQRLASRLPPDRGYVCALEVWTLDALPTSRYREFAPWAFENPGDPLKGD
ncbi:MAG: hypothetical protein AB1679_30465 [Actinomycetota bacterium]